MTPIGDLLYVGDVQDAARGEALPAVGVEAVVRLTHTAPETPYPESLAVDTVPLVDGPQNDPAATRRAVARLRDRLAAGETTLVHCSAGASRSVAVAAGALALVRGVAFDDALGTVRSEHGPSQPHPAVVANARAAVADLGGAGDPD